MATRVSLPPARRAPRAARRAPLTRSEIMQRIRARDSEAELALRSALHALGLRFRLCQRIEGVNVDIVLTRHRVAVFVDGCFWHSCPKHGRQPKSNLGYWLPKLERTRARDRRQTAALRRAGWRVVRVWEHDCRPLRARALLRIARACGL